MAIDKLLYWHIEHANDKAPTNKKIVYANIKYPKTEINIACGVFDDEKYTPLNDSEINFHRSLGAEVTYPVIT